LLHLFVVASEQVGHKHKLLVFFPSFDAENVSENVEDVQVVAVLTVHDFAQNLFLEPNLEVKLVQVLQTTLCVQFRLFSFAFVILFRNVFLLQLLQLLFKISSALGTKFLAKGKDFSFEKQEHVVKFF